jgi:hypothetical protein
MTSEMVDEDYGALRTILPDRRSLLSRFFEVVKAVGDFFSFMRGMG